MSKSSELIFLHKKGVPVPEFIVLSENYELQELTKFLQNHPEDTRYAVRSSANVEDGKIKSYAGLFDTELNVKKGNVSSFVNKCIASKNNNDLLDYHSSKEKISMEIIVQIMINSDFSGVCFTRNPISNKSEYFIEAVIGLGEGLVSGRVTPDQYSLENENGKLIFQNISFQYNKVTCVDEGVLLVPNQLLWQSKKKLSSTLLKKLFKEVSRLKKYYPYEIDIEWTIAKNEVYILQARPLTT